MEKRGLHALAAFRERVAEMEAKGMQAGGTPGDCGCGCYYANEGGSSSAMNKSANNASGLKSKAGVPVGDDHPGNQIDEVKVTPQ